MSKKHQIFISISLPIQWLLVRLLGRYPEWVEYVYSQKIYPLIALILQSLWNWVPFSVGDIFYLSLIIGIIYIGYNTLKKRQSISNVLLTFTTYLSLFYFTFHLFWAINYYRLPLYQSMDLEAEYSTEELYTTTLKLLQSTNALYTELSEETQQLEIPYSRKEIREQASEGYLTFSKNVLPINRKPKSIKNSLFSLSISYLGYGGYFNPFTGEAQVNARVPKTIYTVIATHEQAHQLGYAAENEANFIGVLASIKNPDPYFQYTGYAYGLRYCLNELGRRDKKLYQEIYPLLEDGVKEMYRNQSEFWRQYDSKIEMYSKYIWDSFLKASQQKEGIMSYSYIVALLVNFDKKHPDIFQ